MRRAIGYVLVGLGAFLLVLAPLSRWYVYPRVAVAPLECTDTSAICQDRVLLSPDEGMATTLFDPATLTERSNVPLTGMERVRPDVTASTGADNRTVWDESQTVSDAGTGTLISATTMRIPFDGHTSQMIDCCNANTNGTPIEDFSGINPLKFGFATEQKTYQYYDKTINKATPMEFKGVEMVDGVECYKFVQVVPPTQIGTLEVPGNLVGSPAASVQAPEFYGNLRTVWVEPVTGVIVNGKEQQKQTLRGPDGSDHVTLIEGTIGFTAENVRLNAKLASDGRSQLNLVRSTVPIVGLVGGLLVIGLGLWLILGAKPRDRGPRGGAHAAQPAPEPQPQG
jgi:hypothetical protein